MAPKPESRIVQQVVNALHREVGGYWIKIHGSPFQTRGIPDIIGCCEGKFFGLEIKQPGKEHTLTDYQKYNIGMIEDKGKGVAAMITTAEEAVTLVKRGIDEIY